MDNLTNLQQALVEHDEDMARLDRNTQSYKGPINQPCSACSAGDYKVEHHDHDYVPEENRVCIWESYTSNGFKFWKTTCGDVREKLQERCPMCSRKVALIGFDAWWEARKGYHP